MTFKKKTRRSTRREKRKGSSKECKEAETISEDGTQRQKGKQLDGKKKPKRGVELEDNSMQQDKRKTTSKMTVRNSRPTNNIAIEVEANVEAFIKHAIENGMNGLREECRAVMGFLPMQDTYKKSVENADKNRFLDVPCIDETRVILEQTSVTDSDYIHANRVKIDGVDRNFIMTQGPKENTIEDFWKMIFQEQSPGIIMLCNFYEDGLQKCDEFWPLDNSAFKYYGKMFINNKKVEHQDQYNIYTLEVLPDGCSNSLITRLAHCTVWPDKGVPPSGRMVLRLLKWMQTLETGPVTVLCSAGVGRSGTLIAIESVCTKLFKGQEAKIKEIALDLRKQRAYSIHNELQYLFIYSTVLDYIRAKIPKYHATANKFYTELSQIT